MNCLLSTAYWPNLHYFYYLFNADKIFIEQFENYQKQSFRNRTRILSANGVLDLSIPVKKKATKELTKDIEISYKESWQVKHWRAIISAYKNSPYFEHFESEIEHLYSYRHENLVQFNMEQLRIVLGILKIKKDISHTPAYEKESAGFLDLREKIHPKLGFEKDEEVTGVLTSPYYQTFETKYDFIPNLSILDLLFNKGLEALDYLKV
jgi:hypothetical protein